MLGTHAPLRKTEKICDEGEKAMKRWRAAVIGGGFIGRVHAEALHRLPQAELTALCDPEGAQQKAEAW